MRFYRPYLLISFLLFPFAGHAASGMLDPTIAIGNLNLLISQYESRIKQLESENAILRNEMVKAGIKIPLSEYSGAIQTPLPTATSGVTNTAGTGTNASSIIGANGSNTGTINQIENQYGKDVSRFIEKITLDWNSIRDFYKIAANARIAGYEFVQSGANDHVFVDIVYGSGSAGIYDMKMLYQFEKSQYKRRIVGIFDYNTPTGRYITRPSGSNPFPGIARTFVKDPNFSGVVVPPQTVVNTATGAVSSQPTTPAKPNTTPTPAGNTPEITEILKAYSEKKYLSTISLSTAYLSNNPPTIEILNIRYRTYFIIGKFAESLGELEKIEKLGGLDRQTACNAQVIATYSNNQALISKYTTACKK